jgi:acetyltransferase-like isoleucine patch superfamily enzyme
LNKIPFYFIRDFFYKFIFKLNMAERVTIQSNVRILMPSNIFIGKDSIVNNRVLLDGRGERLFIGSGVDIATEVNIWTTQHIPGDKEHCVISKSVIIEDNVWLCNRVIILPGSIVREGVVVAAGAVVTGELESGYIYGGIPAKKIKKLNSVKTTSYNSYFPWFM